MASSGMGGEGGAHPGPLLHGRYELRDWLGSGGTGTVHRALDTITNAIVAVKILSPLTTSAALRQRREVLALRALQTPGVVRLLDEGTSEGRPFIVMEYIDGAPFPGAGRRTWPEIAGTTLALLEALARVHALGIIHRDLKPGNVLVDATGRPVLLDFGLARGDTLGDAITRPDAVVGTPRYQAPEQLANQPLDARTDLYAVGLMLYEVLAGRPPHPLENLSALIAARVWRDAPPLQYAAPEVPAEVCRVVDRLLARLPEGRPRTANEVLEELRGLSAPDRAPLPWLGPEGPVRAALDAVRLQRPFDLGGPAGSGKTRCLQEIAAGLVRAGRRAAWTARGSRPFESVAPIVGQADTLEITTPDAPEAPADPGEIARRLETRLRETLLGGTVVLVDDAEELDPWSADLLDAVQPDGPVVRAWRSPPDGAYTLHPIAEVDLRPLFWGPDRLLHLREDAARALAERTGGHPGRVVSELAAWVSGGFATWRDGRLALDRTALDRLEGGVAVQVPSPPGALGTGPLKRGLERMLAWVTLAWPHSTSALLQAVCGGSAWEVDMMLRELERVGGAHRTPDGRYEPRFAALALQEWSVEERRSGHAAIAAHLPPGAVGRFSHLVSAGDFAAAAREALGNAVRLAADGYLGRALGVLSQGLDAAREAGDEAVGAELLTEATRTALAENTAGAIKYVRYELARSTPSPALDRLLAGGLALVNGDAAAISDVVGGIPPFDDPTLEVWRRALQLQVAFGRGTAAEVLADHLAWAESSGSTFLKGRVYGWKGLERYRAGAYAESAEWHLRALPLKEGAADRLSTLLNAASSLLEAGDPARALALAAEAEVLAAERRLTLFEARAAWIVRSVRYRDGEPLTPDLPLIEAAGALGSPRFEATLLFQEAAIAWRAGADEQGAAAARRATAIYRAYDQGAAAMVTAALALLCEHVRDPAPWREVAEEAVRMRPGVPVAHALGLVAAGGVVWAPEWTAAAHRALAAEPATDPGRRGNVLANVEVLAYVAKMAARSE